jgi:hypothetical protein
MRYQVDWYSPDLVRIGTLQAFNSLSIVRTENEIGALVMTLPSHGFDTNSFKVGQYLEVWRETHGVSRLFGETAYFVQDWEFYSEGGQHLVAVYAKDLNFLLDTRIVADPPGGTRAELESYADNIMKAIVRNELIDAHSTSPERIIPGVSVQPNVSQSVELYRGVGWQNVLEAVKDIAGSATEQGTYTVFDMVRTGVGTFEFRTYIGQRGTNHSRTSGDVRLVGEIYGNLEDPKLGTYHGEERNYIYCGGKGEGAERYIKEVSDPARIGQGYPYNRKEMFADARNQDTNDQVDTDAYAVLADNKPKVVMTGKLLDTPGMQYGRDYDFGDVVSVEAFNTAIDCHVASVAINYAAEGGETIDISLRGELE